MTYDPTKIDMCDEHGCMIVCTSEDGDSCMECLVSELKEHLENFSKETIARWIVANSDGIDEIGSDFWWIPEDHYDDQDVRVYHLREMEKPLTKERYDELYEIEDRAEKYLRMKFEKEEHQKTIHGKEGYPGWEFFPKDIEGLE